MVVKSFSLLFYLKKPKNYQEGSMPIYLRITVDGIPKEISTGRQCDPDRWNAKAGRANGTKQDVKFLNAYLDTLQTKVHEVKHQLDGSKWIFTNRRKTDTLSRIPILPIALEILEQYKDHFACVNTEKVLPVLSNQKYNEYLKEIANICGINKKLTTHTARHTFATTVNL